MLEELECMFVSMDKNSLIDVFGDIFSDDRALGLDEDHDSSDHETYRYNTQDNQASGPVSTCKRMFHMKEKKGKYLVLAIATRDD
jgi:hypothetical protein